MTTDPLRDRDAADAGAPGQVLDLAASDEVIAERRALALEAGGRLEEATAEDILVWAATAFPNEFMLTSSLTDTVIIHLAGRAVPDVPVIFLDTGYHFPETIRTLEAVKDQFPTRLRVVQPEQSVEEQDRDHGPRLHDRDPDLCCQLRKVQPLEAVLRDYVAWGSGLRRSDSVSRRSTPVVEWDDRRRKVKVSPIARWTDGDVARYATMYGLIKNPLLDKGYPSIGCAPCTRQVSPGEDPRAGRWAESEKTECGIHR